MLTDGRIWNFFHPSDQGNYEERQFAKIDLVEQNPCAVASKLTRYLNRKDVQSEVTLRHAKDDYDKVRLQRQATLKFPSVWHRLLSEPQELLSGLFVEEVEGETGIRSDREQAVEFIHSQVVYRVIPKTSDVHNSAVAGKTITSSFPLASSSPVSKGWVKLLEYNPPLGHLYLRK